MSRVDRQEAINPMNSTLKTWVDECAALTRPDSVVWCDGSEDESRRIIDLLVADGTFMPLNESKFPGCYHKVGYQGYI